MKITEIKNVLLSFLSIILFSKIENLALSIGTSWTISKIIPYIFTILCGGLLGFQLTKINFKNKLIKYLSVFFTATLPFGLGFALHPIYEGDFSILPGEKIIINYSPADFKFDGLTVATIPNCPFCFESIKTLKKIHKRNPNLKIEFIVCARNENYIKNYKKEINGDFPIRMAKNADSLALTAGLKFPAFFIVKNKKPLYKWSNDQFNVLTIDRIESKL